MRLQDLINDELWFAIAKSYNAELYTSAILESMHFLSNVLREKANLEGDGATLVGQALGGDTPRVRINKFETESERNEQKGYEQIIRGLYQAIRNPRSHDHFQDKKDTADTIILFINYIITIIGHAKAFSIDEWIHRILEPDFVSTKRYAELLVEEIPPKRRFDVLIAVYKNKHHTIAHKLTFVFRELLQHIRNTPRIQEFLRIASDEFKIEQDEVIIKSGLILFPNDLWPEIEEVARIRVENKILKSIREGQSESVRGTSSKGGLGLAAIRLFDQLSNKEQCYQAIRVKMNNENILERYYAYKIINPEVIDKMLEGDKVSEERAISFLDKLPLMMKDLKNTHMQSVIIKSIAVAIQFNSTTIKEALVGKISSIPSSFRGILMENIKIIDIEYHSILEEAIENDDIPF